MDEKQIHMPDLTARNAIDFCNNSFDFDGIKKVIFDFKYSNTVEPFGMLMVASKLRRLVERYPGIIWCDNHHDKEYAGHMGFFQSWRIDYGKKPGEAWGSNTYIPITELKVRDLRIESYNRNEVVQTTIERKSYELAKVLSQGNNNLKDVLGYSIRELMRNIVEHSTSESFWFAGQYWPSKDKVEIALLDEGVGIAQALGVNPNLNIKNDKDALYLSIEPGISGKAFEYNGVMRGQSNSDWDNSGYGLFVTSKICQHGGDFLICS
ncbi:hypothetical protein CHH95_21595, partial [Bacillus licheniformis]